MRVCLAYSKAYIWQSPNGLKAAPYTLYNKTHYECISGGNYPLQYILYQLNNKAICSKPKIEEQRYDNNFRVPLFCLRSIVGI